jgi:hypothetical protein
MIRALILTGFICMGTLLRAALPDAVVQACLAPSITDSTVNQTWTIMTAETWENSPMTITETAEASLTAQPGKPHPLEWLTSQITISTPNGDDDSVPLQQTLTIQVTAKGVVPKLTCTINFLDGARLPPCEVITWQGKVAVVSKQKDWYLLALDPAMTVLQTAEQQPRTSIRLPDVTLEKFKSAEGALLIGEGPLR